MPNEREKKQFLGVSVGGGFVLQAASIGYAFDLLGSDYSPCNFESCKYDIRLSLGA
jgi:hypothetical protein